MMDRPSNPLYLGRYTAPRDDRRNPTNPACAVHLRRICGVCPHFEGELRGGPARCGKLGRERSPGSEACEYWSRKVSQ